MEPDSSTNNQPQITYRLIARRTPFLSLPSPPPPLSPFILSTPLSLTSPPSHLPLSLLSRFSSSSFSISPAPRRPLSLPLSSFSSLTFFLTISHLPLLFRHHWRRLVKNIGGKPKYRWRENGGNYW